MSCQGTCGFGIFMQALQVALCRVVSCRVVSCRVVSCRVVSCRVVSCRVVSFFHRTANVLIPDEHGRQECAFNGKAKVLWEELRLDPQDSGRDVRCGHLCRFLI